MAVRFAAVNNSLLLFEVFNEPHLMSVDNLNAMNAAVLPIIRDTNPTRTVRHRMVAGLCNGIMPLFCNAHATVQCSFMGVFLLTPLRCDCLSTILYSPAPTFAIRDPAHIRSSIMQIKRCRCCLAAWSS